MAHFLTRARQGNDAGLEPLAALPPTFSAPVTSAGIDMRHSASSTNVATVSLQDLLIHDLYSSAPNSTALTFLTSPSMGAASPDSADGYDTSPHFGAYDYEPISHANWFPLFPQEPGLQAADHSPAQHSDELEVACPTSDRRPPSLSKFRTSVPSTRFRRRDKNIGPIVLVDPQDVVAVKRARNTLAARKSRERKAVRMEELEDRISKLEAERDYWKALAKSTLPELGD